MNNTAKWRQKHKDEHARDQLVAELEEKNARMNLLESVNYWTNMIMGAVPLVFMSFLCTTDQSNSMGDPWMWLVAAGLWCLRYIRMWIRNEIVRADNAKYIKELQQKKFRFDSY